MLLLAARAERAYIFLYLIIEDGKCEAPVYWSNMTVSFC